MEIQDVAGPAVMRESLLFCSTKMAKVTQFF